MRIPEQRQLEYMSRIGRQLAFSNPETRSHLESTATDLEALRPGLERLEADEVLLPEDFGAWEAIIHTTGRPGLQIIHDAWSPPTLRPPWTDVLKDELIPSLRPLIASVGRIEPSGPGLNDYNGTGFVVARQDNGRYLLMTNRHVARDFVTGGPGFDRPFFRYTTAQVDTVAEVLWRPEKRLLRVERCVLVHPYWDLALFEVELIGDGELSVVPLATEMVQSGHHVAVVGYPAPDPRNDAELQAETFRVFRTKQLQPGVLVNPRVWESSFGRQVEVLEHDCSTLGGNSGSPVLDLTGGKAIGLHFKGRYLEGNFAVPTWELARDPELVALGLFPNLGGVAAEPPFPPTLWETNESTSATSSLRGDKLESPTLETDLEALAKHDPDAARAALDTLTGDAELTQQILDEWASDDLERRIDPDKPILVFLHGILGSHLAPQDGLVRRWMGARVLGSTLAEKLHLVRDDQGELVDRDGRGTEPDGHLQSVYLRARLRWRYGNRFDVRAFSYDWRCSFEKLADDLEATLRPLLDEGKPVVLVGHSMGGVVSALWAARHDASGVERAIFMGSPLGGSYSALAALGGIHSLIGVVDGYTFNKAHELVAAFRSWPGLVEMLPDPDLFPEVALLLDDPALWPEGAPIDPADLQRARDLKAEIYASPLKDRTTLLVSLSHETDGQVELQDGSMRISASRLGDGTVPGKAAAIEGWKALTVTGEHATMPLFDTEAVKAVAKLAVGEDPGLAPIDRSRLDELSALESTGRRIQPADERALRRLENNTYTLEDVAWVLGGPPPIQHAPTLDVRMRGDRATGWSTTVEPSDFPWDTLTQDQHDALNRALGRNPQAVGVGYQIEATPLERMDPQPENQPPWFDGMLSLPETGPHDFLLILDEDSGELTWLLPDETRAFRLLLYWKGAALRLKVAHLQLIEDTEGLGKILGRFLFKNRVRSWTQDDFGGKPTRLLTSSTPLYWEHVSDGGPLDGRKALLMIHGTGRQTVKGFEGFTDQQVRRLAEHYGDRIIAFDHWTGKHTPWDNIRTLRRFMPSGPGLNFHFDVVAMSRGGLVTRLLAEDRCRELLSPHTIQIDRVMFVGCTNGGTPAARAKWGMLSSKFARMTMDLEKRAGERLEETIGGALQPGLLAQKPGSDFLKEIGEDPIQASFSPRYHALVATAAAPTSGAAADLLKELTEDCFGTTEHDSLVPHASTIAPVPAPSAPYFPIPEERIFRAEVDPRVHHHSIFQATRDISGQIVEWLTQDE